MVVHTGTVTLTKDLCLQFTVQNEPPQSKQHPAQRGTPTEPRSGEDSPLGTPTEPRSGEDSPLGTPTEPRSGEGSPLDTPTEPRSGEGSPLDTPTEPRSGEGSPLDVDQERFAFLSFAVKDTYPDGVQFRAAP
jgi:hypothetical protein